MYYRYIMVYIQYIIIRYIYISYVFICRSNVVIMRLPLPCSRVCWIWTEASMDLCAFWFVAAPEASTLVRSRQSTQFVRTTPVCSLGLHSLSAELLLRNRLCWVDDVWWHMGKHCGRHCTLFPWHGVASTHFRHTAQHSAAIDWVSSLPIVWTEGTWKAALLLVVIPRQSTHVICPSAQKNCKPWLHQVPQTKWALVSTKTFRAPNCYPSCGSFKTLVLWLAKPR